MNSPATLSPEFLIFPATHKHPLLLITISLIIITITPNPSKSQPSASSSSPATGGLSGSPDSVTNLQPSLAVVIAVLAIMFTLTFFLLIYAKCCRNPSSLQYLNQEITLGEPPRSLSRVFSGVDKTVIESLPFFRFSMLKGSRNGLECSICLSKFEDIEILRFLPKCKHAFHIDCVDRWLEKHSGCPLCRCKVSENDVALFTGSGSLGFLSGRLSDREGLGLFVEREGSARSFRKIETDDEEILHRFNHRIVVSGFDHDGMKNRWSNLRPSDLMFLESEMITSSSSNAFASLSEHERVTSTLSNAFAGHYEYERVTSGSSNHFDRHPRLKTQENGRNNDQDHRVVEIKQEIERKREFESKIKNFPCGKVVIGSSDEPKSLKCIEKRSMSEIVVHPRFLGVEESRKEGDLGEINDKEERLRRLWLPIARRTVQWFVRDQNPNINTISQVG